MAELSCSWQSQHRDSDHSQLFTLTFKCPASSDCPDSAPGADDHVSPLSHINEPASPNYHFSCTASTRECIWKYLKLCVNVDNLHLVSRRFTGLMFVLCFLRCCYSPSSSKPSLSCWRRWSPTPAWLLLWPPPRPWPPPQLQYRALHCRWGHQTLTEICCWILWSQFCYGIEFHFRPLWEGAPSWPQCP